MFNIMPWQVIFEISRLAPLEGKRDEPVMRAATIQEAATIVARPAPEPAASVVPAMGACCRPVPA